MTQQSVETMCTLTEDEIDSLIGTPNLIGHTDRADDGGPVRVQHGRAEVVRRLVPAIERIVAARMERGAGVLDDLALTLMTTSDDNPEGNALTAAVVQKCAEIIRTTPGQSA